MKHIKVIISVWLTTLVYIIGGIDASLKCLLTLMCVDYFTGVSKGYYNNELSSYKGFKGLVKKLNILSIIVVANMIDEMLGKTGTIRTLTIYYICCNEGLSIIENLSAMNIIVPKWLKEKLIQVKKETEENGSSNA